MALDYQIWTESEGDTDEKLYFWEIVRIGTADNDWQDTILESGTEHSQAEAEKRVREAIRRHRNM